VENGLRRSALTACALGTVFSVSLTGCTLGPNFQRPAAWWSPASWVGNRPPITPVRDVVSRPDADPPDPEWWSVFHDPELSSLERRVAAANFDVRLAGIRLAESRSQLGMTRADQFAQLNGNGSYTRERESPHGVIGLLGSGSGSPGTQSNGLGGTQGGIPNSTLSAPFDLYQYGFDASWELDLWGRVRRSVESAQAQVDESAESRRDELITALGEVARDYLQLRGTQRVIDVVQRNLADEQRGLGLTQERAQAGLTTELDVANQSAQVQSTASQLPGLQAQAQNDINAIALLLGEPPDALNSELSATQPLPPVPPSVPVGLPGEQARRRPDIRRAEANLHAATAGVGVAVASFYPTVTLSGSVALQATQFKYLGDWASNTYALGPSITLPIFQGGKLTRTLELRKGQEQEAAVSYQQTVLAALHDVNNALTNYDAQQGQVASLARAVEQQRRALSLAQDQYQSGLTTFIDVLNAERQVLSGEQDLAQAQSTLDTDLVQIYKALGGGWEQEYPETATAQKAPLIPAALVEP
jgi:NodT family efflux transporter outer membrane factor (OMF) lipoprotein